jgi:hypothetical protein
MAITCPNTNSQDWKDLVKIHGESLAAYLWNRYSGFVPSELYTTTLPDIFNNKNILYRQGELGDRQFEDVRDTLYSVFIKSMVSSESFNAGNSLGTGTNKGEIANGYASRMYKSADGSPYNSDNALKAIELELAYDASVRLNSPEEAAKAKQALFTFLKSNNMTFALTDNLKVRNTYKNIYGNWNTKVDELGNITSIGWRDILVDKLAEAGYKINATPESTDIEDVMDVEEMEPDDFKLETLESTEEKIYNKQSVEVNPAKKLTQAVKELLATVPSGETNWLGQEIYLSRDEVYKALLNIWVGKQSFADMKAALESYTQYKPAYRNVLNFINTLDGQKQAMLYSAFALNYNKFLLFKKETTKAGTTVSIINPNLKTISKEFTGKWRTQSTEQDIPSDRALYRMNDQGVIEIKPNKLEEINRAVDRIEKFLKDRTNADTLVQTSGVHEIVRELGNLLWEMSINIGDNVRIEDTYANLQKYLNTGDNILSGKKYIKANGRLLFLDLYNKAKAMSVSLNNKNKTVDIYKNNRGDIEYIARILPYFINQVGDTFISGSGKSIYPANQETQMDQIVNTIKGLGNKSEMMEMYLGDSFISGYNDVNLMSFLFRHFGNEEFLSTFAVETLDTVKDDKRIEAQDYEDFSKLDSVATRLNAFINAGNKKFFRTSMTLGSRGTMKMVTMPRIGNVQHYGIDTTIAKEVKKQIIQDFIRIYESNKFINKVITDNAKIPMEQRDYSMLIEGTDYRLEEDEQPTNANIEKAIANKTAREFDPAFMQFTALNEEGQQIVTDEVINDETTRGNTISDFIERYIKNPTSLNPGLKELIDERLDSMTKDVLKYFETQATELYKTLSANGKLAELDNINAKSLFGGTKEAIKDFVVNDALARNELTKLFRGRRTMTKNVVDFYKRMELLGTPKTKMAEKGTVGRVSWMSEDYGVPRTLREATIQDIKLDLTREIRDEKGNIVKESQKTRVDAEAARMQEGLEKIFLIEAEEANMQILQDPTVTTSEKNRIIAEYTAAAKDQAERIANQYKAGKVDGTDALAHITLDAYRYMRQGLGLWSREEEEAFKVYKALPAGQKVFAYQEGFVPKGFKAGDRVIILPMKPFYGGLKNENGRVMTIIHKNSYQVLLEEYTKDYPVLNDLRNSMETRGIHIVNTVSAKKAAKLGIHVVTGTPGEFNNMATQEILSNGLGFPQFIPSMKEEKKQLINKQLKKNIIADLNMSGTYVYNAGLDYAQAITGADLKDNFERAIEEKLRRAVAEIDNELGFDELAEAEKSRDPLRVQQAKNNVVNIVRDLLRKDAIKKQLSSNYINILNVEQTVDGTLRFKTPLDLPVYAKKYESILLSIFQNRAYNQKLPGYEAVQVAQIGGHEIDDELKFLSIEDDPITGQRVVHAECAIREDLARRFGIEPGQSLDSVPEELRRLLGYRIPNQGKSSTIILKIAKILPSNYAKAIVVPGQITKLMGSDFDVDKMNLLFPEITTDENGNLVKVRVDYNKLNATKNFEGLSEQELNNVLYDSMEAVMSSKYHVRETMAPLDTEYSKTEQTRIRKAIPEYGKPLDWNSPMTESEITERNINAAKLIGKYANILSGRNVAMYGQLEAVNEFAIKIDNTIYTDYVADGKTASDKISDSVDASKEPVQKELNDNPVTANVASWFIAHFPDPSRRLLHNFLNQPIIRDLVDEITTRHKGDLRKMNKAYRDIYNKYNKNPKYKPLKHQNIITKNMSSEELENLSRENRDSKQQIIFLNNFYKFYKGGAYLSELYKQLTPDTLTSVNRVGDLQAFKDKVNKFNAYSENGVLEKPAIISKGMEGVNPIAQFTSENSVYRTTKAYHEFIDSTMDKISRVFGLRLSTASQVFKEGIKNNTGNTTLTPEMHDAVDNSIIFSALLREGSPIRDMFSGANIRRLYKNKDTNLAKRLRDLKAKNPLLLNNRIITAFETELDPELGITFLKFEGAFGLEPNLKNKFEKDFANLIYNPQQYATTPEDVAAIKEFGEDLIANNFIRYGFGSKYGSYFDIIPLQYFRTPIKMEDKTQSISEYLHDQKIAMMVPSYFNSEDMLDFMQMFGGLVIKGSPLLNPINTNDETLGNEVVIYKTSTFAKVRNSEETETGLYLYSHDIMVGEEQKAVYVALDKTYHKNSLYGIHKDASSPEYRERRQNMIEAAVGLTAFDNTTERETREVNEKFCVI